MSRTIARTLTLSTGTSRGRETYGYTIVRLRDSDTDKVYRCMGGGYDMVGTVLAAWLVDTHQQQLRSIAGRAFYRHGTDAPTSRTDAPDALYGMAHNALTGSVSVDGACGVESVLQIAEAAGVDLTRTHSRGQTSGWIVAD